MALSNAERQKAYRERKKAQKDRRSREEAGKVSDSPVDPDPELQQQPVFEWQAPPPCVVEGHPDDLAPVKIEPETLTYFDVYKRRHEGMFK